EEYAAFYQNLRRSMSRRRVTDLNDLSIRWLVDSIPLDASSFADIGCGNGYLLQRVQASRADLALTGIDIVRSESLPGSAEYRQGLLPSLPFDDESFDVVACTHVLEHVVDLEACVRELSRIT